MDPQDPNTPKQPEIDTSNPFDQFYNDTEEQSEQIAGEQEIPVDIQATINELAPQVPAEEPAESTITPQQPIEPTPEEPLPAEANFPDTTTPEMAPSPDMPLAQPMEQPQPAPTQTASVPKPSIRINSGKIIMGLVLFLLMTAAGAVGVLAATGNLDLPFIQPVMQQIQKLPFFPKTAEYVMGNAMSATVLVDSYHYDMSASINIASQQFGLGGGDTQFDIAVNGDATFDTDGIPDKVQGTLSFGSALEGFNGTLSLNYLLAEEMFYLQTKNVTGTFTSFSSFMPTTDTWYSLDMSSLDTQARSALEATISPTPTEEQVYAYFKEVMERLFEGERFQQEITLSGTETMTDDTDAYHLKIVPSVDTIMEIYSEFVKYDGGTVDPEEYTTLRESLNNLRTFTIDIWIDEANFMLRKLQVVGSFAYAVDEVLPALPIVFNPEGPLVAGVSKVLSESDIQEDTIDFSIVTEFTNINQTPVITIPTNHTPLEELFNTALEQLDPQYSEIDLRNSDIISTIGYVGTALNEYSAENNGTYPATLSALTETGILFLTPTPPDERVDLGCTVTTEYAYVHSGNQAAVWADLEPCTGGETQEWYVYWTACGRTSTVTGAPPNETTIVTGEAC